MSNFPPTNTSRYCGMEARGGIKEVVFRGFKVRLFNTNSTSIDARQQKSHRGPELYKGDDGGHEVLVLVLSAN